MDVETLPGKKIDISDVSEVSARDIYMRLCACRDFEIKLQWERAVFLTAFLIACFAGYGSFLLEIHEHGSGAGNFSSLVTNGIFIALTFVGFIISILWVLMAKGSKAWYEHYEQAIIWFSGKYPDKTAVVDPKLVAHRWKDLPGMKRNAMSNCPFRLCGGAYSVSKMVIAIGVMSMMSWGCLLLLHCAIAIFGPVSLWKPCVVIKALLIIAAVIVVVALPCWLACGLKSGYLKDMYADLEKAEKA